MFLIHWKLVGTQADGRTCLKIVLCCLFYVPKTGDTCSKKLLQNSSPAMNLWMVGWTGTRNCRQENSTLFYIANQNSSFLATRRKRGNHFDKVNETRNKAYFYVALLQNIQKTFTPNQNVLGKKTEFACCAKKFFGKTLQPQ